MTEPAREIIDACDWAAVRFGWLESVMRDTKLSASARLVAYHLALTFANHRTMQCNPSYRQIAALLARDPKTAQRAVGELVDASWIACETGSGRTRSNDYKFLTRAQIVRLKGDRNVHLKGDRSVHVSVAKRGTEMSGKGDRNVQPYNIAKPYKNHRAADTAVPGGIAPSQNPLVVRQAEGAVKRFREGRADAFDGLPVWTKNHIIAANLLTDAERQAACLG